MAKLEKGGWLSWIGMVTMLLVRDGWLERGRVTKLVRDGWLSRKGMVAMFVSDGRLSG